MNTITAPPRAPKSSTSTIESSTTESPGTGSSQAGPERPGFLGSIPEAITVTTAVPRLKFA